MQITKQTWCAWVICTLVFTCGLFAGCLAKPLGKETKYNPSKDATKGEIQLTALTSRYKYGQHNFMDVAITNSNELWGVGYDGEDPRRLYYSKDGGQTWKRRSLATSGFTFQAIAFVDAQYGWVVGANGLILRTTDGGESWKELQKPSTSDLTDVQFINSRIGYIAASNSSKDPATGTGIYGIEILCTKDGGENWKVCYRNDKAANVFQLATLSERIVVAAIDSNTLIRTEDGGASWRVVVTGKGEFRSVVFNSDGIGWAVGEKGSFYHSRDQGKTWQKLQGLPGNFSKQDWWSIDFADAHRGLAVGDNGAIAITDDGGLTWRAYDGKTTENLRKVRLRDNKGIILGSQKVYGITFTPLH